MRRAVLTVFAIIAPAAAYAHASEGGFVLLLPTDLYVAGGAVVVGLTVLFLAVAPNWHPNRLFRPYIHLASLGARARPVIQTLSLILLVLLIVSGFTGATDPLRNPLTLGLWTVFWITLVGVQAVVFDIWRWINPFAALSRLTSLFPSPLKHHRPNRWISVALFLAFSGFLLADPAPSDPRRLAAFATAYLVVTTVALALFGPRWLARAEFLTALMRLYRQTAIAAPHGPARALGPNGWRILRLGVPALPTAVFILILLGSGSFDGLNETFWWLGLLGVNPLEFPGRSAVVAPTLAGLLVVNATLILAYTLCIALGLRLIGSDQSLRHAICLFAPSILPIAAGYHVAHYLTSFLVDSQHVVSLISSTLGFGERAVTTGFFNRLDTVRLIWLSQAGAVVLGHVVAIVVAHGIALRAYQDPRRATLSQLPLAFFMIAYTVFGLWLLAAPKGA